VTPVRVAVDNSGRGVVLTDAGPLPFDVDLSTGSAALTTSAGLVLVRSMTWREKLTIARFQRLGRVWVDHAIADACASPRSTDGPSDGLLAGLARWLEGGSDEPDDLDADRLAAVTVALCRAIELPPHELDALPAGEVEGLWKAVRAGSADAGVGADLAPARPVERAFLTLPRNDDAWGAGATRIVVVADPVRAAPLAGSGAAAGKDAAADPESAASPDAAAVVDAEDGPERNVVAEDAQGDGLSPDLGLGAEPPATPRPAPATPRRARASARASLPPATPAAAKRVGRWGGQVPASRTASPIRVVSEPAVLDGAMPGGTAWSALSRSSAPAYRPAVRRTAPREASALPAAAHYRAPADGLDPLPGLPVAVRHRYAGRAIVRPSGDVAHAVPRHAALRGTPPRARVSSISTPGRPRPSPLVTHDLPAPDPLVLPVDVVGELRTLDRDERIQLLQHMADELERAAEDLGIGDATR
jgi:hypothetical protein